MGHFYIHFSVVSTSFSFVEMLKSTAEILDKMFSWVCNRISTGEGGAERVIRINQDSLLVPKFTFWKTLCFVLFRSSDSWVMWFQLSLDVYKNLLIICSRQRTVTSQRSRHQIRQRLHTTVRLLMIPLSVLIAFIENSTNKNLRFYDTEQNQHPKHHSLLCAPKFSFSRVLFQLLKESMSNEHKGLITGVCVNALWDFIWTPT